MKKDKDIKSLFATFTEIGEQPEEPRPQLRDEAPEILESPESQDEEPEKAPDILDTIENQELREALRVKRLEGRGRPRKNGIDGKRTDGYSRFTIVASIEKMAKLKEIAFRNTLTQKEVYEEALDLLITKYEEVHGEIIPEPEKYKGNIKNIFNK